MTEKFKETFHSLFGGDTFSHLLSKNFEKVFPYNYTKRRRIGEEPTYCFWLLFTPHWSRDVDVFSAAAVFLFFYLVK